MELPVGMSEKYGRYEKQADTNSVMCGLKRETTYESRMPPGFDEALEGNADGWLGLPKP